MNRQPTASLRLLTAGVHVEVRDLTGRQVPPLARAAGIRSTGSHPRDPNLEESSAVGPDVQMTVEPSRRPFAPDGLSPVTRGVLADGGLVVMNSVGGSGFDQAWQVSGDSVEVRSRWVPDHLERGASALRSRHHSLRAQVLLHHPALWWAGTRGFAPLHVSVLDLDGVVVMLAGPGGVGKSTLVARAVAGGSRATCDNLAVSDGTWAYGLREALRLPPGEEAAPTGSEPGRRTTHGRRELTWSGQVPGLRPDLVVVGRRGAGPQVRTVDAETACRALVAGTYAAGELRRFWSLSAVLGLATGRGPVQPAVESTARMLSSRLPCLELELGHRPGPTLQEMLAPQLERAREAGVAR